MKLQKLQKRLEIKRMQASFSQIKKETKRKPNLIKCIKCKRDTGNNFVFVYKKNNELKGKLCTACSKNQSSPTVNQTNHLLL